MDFRERLLNLNFVLRLCKSIQPRIADMLLEPLTREMIAALGKLSKVADDASFGRNKSR
jgi:hypothetical protein